MRFLHLPTPDMTGASQAMLDLGVAFAARAVEESRRLLIHCEHGIGRSATLGLCVLADRGFEPIAALRLAKDARALISPSQAQHETWVQWLRRRHPGCAPPTYHDFGVVAYRHLARSG
jgi:protein-tyrosine phosphatase